MFALVTQRATYLYRDLSLAQNHARNERKWWSDHCPDIGPVPCCPETVTPAHLTFDPDQADRPVEPGFAQARDPEVMAACARWWEERDAWWADTPILR